MASRKLAAALHAGVAALLFTGFCVLGLAANPETAARERESAAEKFVTQKLHIWQARLNLQDWDIRFRWSRPKNWNPRLGKYQLGY